jgi:hypothetical protein
MENTMRKSWIAGAAGAAAIAASITAVSAAANQGDGTQGTAANTVGHGAQIELFATLRTAVPVSGAVTLTRTINDIPGVAYTEFVPGQGGITIGVTTKDSLDAVTKAVAAEPGVQAVSLGVAGLPNGSVKSP